MPNTQAGYRDPYREEVVGGEVVILSPTSNDARVTGNLTGIFGEHLWNDRREYFSHGIDVRLDEENVFVPDGCVVCDPERIRADGVYGAPDFVIEVLSPATANRDRGVKMETYARHGVSEYWLIDPSRLSVEIYGLEGRAFRRRCAYEYRPTDADTKQDDSQVLRCGLFPDLDVPLARVFDRAVVR